MKILALDTTMQACSASFLDTDNGGGQQSVYEALERGHAEAIVPMIESVMNVGGCTYQELDRIGVTLGPGAFTGVRVGVATARGLGLSVEAEVLGFSSLHVMAVRACELLDETAFSGIEQLVVAVDAKRGEVYVQVFSPEAVPLNEASAIVPEKFSDLVKDKASLVVGSGGEVIADVGADFSFALPDLLPDAQSMCKLIVSGEGAVETLSPLYLRAPDAKPQAGKQVARA